MGPERYRLFTTVVTRKQLESPAGDCKMADREHLHALVDSLPEGALESAQTYLQAIQIWPPKEPEYPPEVEQHRKELEAKRDKFLKRPASGTWAIGKNKSHGSYGTSEHNWETGE